MTLENPLWQPYARCGRSGSWALLFLLEAMAVWGVLRKFKYDPQQAVRALAAKP